MENMSQMAAMHGNYCILWEREQDIVLPARIEPVSFWIQKTRILLNTKNEIMGLRGHEVRLSCPDDCPNHINRIVSSSGIPDVESYVHK